MKNTIKSRNCKKISGFTLVEVMVVVVILGILGALVIPNIMDRPAQARLAKTKQDILAVQSMLDLYKLDNGFYPSTDQGLAALVSKPTAPPVPRNWKAGGYIHELPMDPWDSPYQYINDNESIKLFSYGPKGKEGGGEIGNWNLNSERSSVS